jgi:hypothetical protein
MTRFFHRCFACGEKAWEWAARPREGMLSRDMVKDQESNDILVCRTCGNRQTGLWAWQGAWVAWTWKDVIVEREE